MNYMIDARWITPEPSGIPIYTQEIIRAMLPLLEDHETLYLLIKDRRIQTRLNSDFNLAKNPQVQWVYTRFGPHHPLSQLTLPTLFLKHQIQVFHSPNYMLPMLPFPGSAKKRTQKISTIHDLIPLRFPHFTPRALKSRYFRIYKQLMYGVGRTSDRIITVSNASRQDALNHLKLPPEQHPKVTTIYNGYARDFTPQNVPKASPRTILYVGRQDPYKNVPTLIHAFSDLVKKGIPDIQLHIISHPDPRYPQATQLIKKLNLKKHVKWDADIDHQALIDAYRKATVFVLPSRYEGFGLPVIEAMACATPVICSDTSSLPEIAAGAALHFEPQNKNQLVRHLIDLLESPALQESMVQKGLERADQFNWEKTATQTLQLYRECSPNT